jgi:uncharacterized protein
MNYNQSPSIYNNQSVEAQEATQRSFILRVYGWMTIGLVVTALSALFTVASGLVEVLISNTIIFFGLIIGELVMVVVLSRAINRFSTFTAGLLFLAYSVLNGVTLSIILLVYTGSSIAVTFGITAATFGIMTLFGYTTQRDLTKMGSLLIMALIGFLVASVVNIFLNSSALYYIITYIGILIFVGLVAYDTQKLKRLSLGLSEDGLMEKASILGALTLYLDFINLFLLLLRLLGRRR